MKTLLWVCIAFVAFVGNTFALSCAEFPTFQDMYADAEVAFVGTVEAVDVEAKDYDKEFCAHQWGNATPATTTFTFADVDIYKGVLGNAPQVTRDVNLINCTRWGACDDMKLWERYVVLTDNTMELGEWLCSPCPYMLASEFALPVEPVYEPEIPSACVTWYDGCNTCSVRNGQANICTRMACFVKERAYCTSFEFSELTQNQVDLITTVVNNWLDTATSSQRDAVLAKVQQKIQEVNVTLATSTFITWSKALQEYQFLLEVLWMVESLL